MSIDKDLQVVFICGESAFEVKERVTKFVKANSDYTPKNIQAEEVESIKMLDSLNGGHGFFSSKELLILNDFVDSKHKDDVLDYLKSSSMGSDIKLCFVKYGKPDKRGKLYKFLKKEYGIIEFPAPKSAEKKLFILEYLRKQNFKWSREVETKLMSILLRSNLQHISMELEKLRLLLGSENNSLEIELRHLEILTIEAEEEVWELMSLALKDKSQSLKLLRKLLRQGSNPQMLMGFLTLNLQQINDYYYNPQKLAPFIKQKTAQMASKISARKLSILISQLALLDIKLKSQNINGHLALAQFLTIV